MENLDKQAELMNKTVGKVLKILEKLEEPTAIAVINCCFLIMIIDGERGPIAAKAMAATFINNVMNSVNDYFYAEHDECEHVH